MQCTASSFQYSPADEAILYTQVDRSDNLFQKAILAAHAGRLEIFEIFNNSEIVNNRESCCNRLNAYLEEWGVVSCFVWNTIIR